MISESTVFIIGAGSGVPYGFPTGAKLREEILEDFVSKFETIVDNSHDADFDPDEAKDHALRFRDTFERTPYLSSIDFFVSDRSDYREIAKMAIVLHILEAEGKFILKNEESKIKDWFDVLLYEMLKELNKQGDYLHFANKDKNDVTFVTFNYDRLLEYLFWYGLNNFYGSQNVDIQQLIQVFNKIEIIHVYGKIASLRLKDYPHEIQKGVNKIALGDIGSDGYAYSKLYRSKDNILTMYDERQRQSNEAIHSVIDRAERIVFFGFGYDPDNTKILGLPLSALNGKQVYGTAKGSSLGKIARFKDTIGDQKFHDEIDLFDCDCKRLLEEHIFI